MTEKLITFDELKIITLKIESRLNAEIDNSNLNHFHQKVLAELIELDFEYQDSRTEEESEYRDFEDFYDYKQQVYEPLSIQIIQNLYTQIRDNSTPEYFKILIDVMINLSNHNHFIIREEAIFIIKTKNINATFDYLIKNFESNETRFVNTLFNLNVNVDDWEKYLKHRNDWSLFAELLRKVAKIDQNLTEDTFYKNNGLCFMNVVYHFCYFIPAEIASLENEIIYYISTDYNSSRNFECVLFPFQFFYPELKPYFSEVGKQKMKNIIHQVAKDEYSIDDVWVIQNVLPTLKVISENDTECEATVALLQAFEIEKEKQEENNYINEEVYLEIITFCENLLTQKSPEKDTNEYYNAIHELVNVNIKYANQVLNSFGNLDQVYYLLNKAADYTEIYYNANFSLDQELINYFFDILTSLKLELESDLPFLKKVITLHERFSKI